VPELLQDKCTGPRVAEEVLRLLDDDTARATQAAAAEEALALLRPAGGSPSGTAADVVLSYIRNGNREGDDRE